MDTSTIESSSSTVTAVSSPDPEITDLNAAFYRYWFEAQQDPWTKLYLSRTNELCSEHFSRQGISLQNATHESLQHFLIVTPGLPIRAAHKALLSFFTYLQQDKFRADNPAVGLVSPARARSDLRPPKKRKSKVHQVLRRAKFPYRSSAVAQSDELTASAAEGSSVLTEDILNLPISADQQDLLEVFRSDPKQDLSIDLLSHRLRFTPSKTSHLVRYLREHKVIIPSSRSGKARLYQLNPELVTQSFEGFEGLPNTSPVVQVLGSQPVSHDLLPDPVIQSTPVDKTWATRAEDIFEHSGIGDERRSPKYRRTRVAFIEIVLRNSNRYFTIKQLGLLMNQSPSNIARIINDLGPYLLRYEGPEGLTANQEAICISSLARQVAGLPQCSELPMEPYQPGELTYNPLGSSTETEEDITIQEASIEDLSEPASFQLVPVSPIPIWAAAMLERIQKLEDNTPTIPMVRNHSVAMIEVSVLMRILKQQLRGQISEGELKFLQESLRPYIINPGD